MYYQATIHFSAIEDDYEQGEIGGSVNDWIETIEADTTKELKEKVLQATYSTELDDEQINDYSFATEYATSYLADENNEGDASPKQIEQWKLGKLKLYAINCHILVTEVSSQKASL